MYDSHTHTINSPDSTQTIDDLCLAAIEKGVTGVAITDHTHADPAYQNYFPGFVPEPAIRQSIKDALYAKEKYGHTLDVTCGIEVDEYLNNPKENDKLLELYDFDVVLGSIHYLANKPWKLQYSKIPYGSSISDTEILDYLKAYFEAVCLVAEKTDIDVLTHLTCPMRYVNGRHKKGIDITNLEPLIKDILKVIISRNIALEINTAGILREEFGCFLCPEKNIIKTYRDMGGKLLTLGSDAHRKTDVAVGFKETKAILKEIGFDKYHFFKNRKPMEISID